MRNIVFFSFRFRKFILNSHDSTMTWSSLLPLTLFGFESDIILIIIDYVTLHHILRIEEEENEISNIRDI